MDHTWAISNINILQYIDGKNKSLYNIWLITTTLFRYFPNILQNIVYILPKYWMKFAQIFPKYHTNIAHTSSKYCPNIKI